MKKLDENFFERRKTLVGFSSSLLAHFNVTPFHETDPEVDALLKGHKKVCVFLFDGAGKYNLNLFPKANRYLLSHSACEINSTNPPTTAAATNAFLTGKWPMETGWIGWSVYIPELGFPLNIFPDTNSLNGRKVDYFHDGSHFMDRYCPIKKLDALLREKGVKAKLQHVAPLGGKDSFKTFKEQGEFATRFFQEEGGEFLYSYHDCPDHHMHQYGVGHRKIKNDYKQINKMVEKFVKDNPDVLVITMADHGLIDVEYQDLADYPEITDCLRGPMSIEGRNANFMVKEERKEDFAKLFPSRFPDFVLLTKEEVLSQGVFGVGEENEHFQGFLGDFLAIAVGKTILQNSLDNPDKFRLKGHHAGQTLEERIINLSVFNR